MQKGALVMGRLIDADKFILAIMDASLSSVDEDTILDLIDSVPTVDAVPVVRCVVCQWAKPKNKIIFCFRGAGRRKTIYAGYAGATCPCRSISFLLISRWAGLWLRLDRGYAARRPICGIGAP